jgi:tetratricopeptide (TPR) repeat protein
VSVVLDRPEDLGRGLDPSLRARLDAGDHEAVAAELAAAERYAEAGWVLEQIWDFARATQLWLAAGRLLDALRTAIEDRTPATLAAVFEAFVARRGDLELLREAARLLDRRGRHDDAARVLELAEAGPEDRAAALLKAGDRLAAAELLAEAGQPRRALELLGSLENTATYVDPNRDGFATLPAHPREHALAAALCWDLGDAEGTARHAQQARRAGAIEGELGRRVRHLLARALSSLGHDLAGQLVLGEGDESEAERLSLGGSFGGTGLAPHGRYRVTATLSASFAGAAYVGVDRVSLQEVEIHLLLAEFGEHERPGSAVLAALARFAAAASRADALAHPAIRPILRLDPDAGLLVMPRREGPVLRSLIRPPGLDQASARARSLVAFMLDALATGHAAGLVHGSLLPSQIVCDALGRPLLGPFGAHHLAGLVATRTGGLEELLTMTPPEQRTGAEPSQAGDVYMAGALWAALLAGRFGPSLDELPASDRDELAGMLAIDPRARPSAREVLARLRAPIDDISVLASGGPTAEDSIRGPERLDPRLGGAIDVVAADSWSDTDLDLLCTARNPWLQNILDREGRAFRLAAWPEGCRKLDADARWDHVVDPLAIELLSPGGEPNAPEGEDSQRANQTLREAVLSRLDGAAIVVTPAGELMLALDCLLRR